MSRKMQKVVTGLTMAVLVLTSTGCVKRIKTAGGTEIDFVTGADISFGLNGVDTVNNNRGIKPGSSGFVQPATKGQEGY